MLHRAPERLEVGVSPTYAPLTNQRIPTKIHIEPSGNEALESVMAGQPNMYPSSGVDSPTGTIPPTTSLNSQTSDTTPSSPKSIFTDFQTTSEPPSRKCGCKCDTDCNCACSCKNHCTCVRHTCQGCDAKCQVKCDKKCGSASFRNLVVCLDGTSNQFGHRNTNVVELHSRILKGDPHVQQLTFYSSGIGTYVPPLKFSPANWLRIFDNIVDMAIAWNFKHIVEEAYQWLADHYQPGDRIYLFGFSRGAYQIRALSGMIERLGLVFPGNRRLIPFGYELYINKHRGKKIKDDAEAEALALNFKHTFSRPSVKIHFLGAWDTVSSVGIVREQSLPLTSASDHICFFRHGLALDERRVKFLPEYFDKGLTPRFESQSQSTDFTDVEEVWFAGSHSDIGGGNRGNHLDRTRTFDLSLPPLLWMEDEASAVGLKLSSQRMGGEWKWGSLHKDMPTKSLKGLWWVLENLPITRLLYTDERSTTRKPNRGYGRAIVPQQRVHASVAFMDVSYRPSASFTDEKAAKWEDLIGKGRVENLSWADTDAWKDILETDMYDDYHTQDAIRELKDLRANYKSVGIHLLERLSFMALSHHGAHRISEITNDLVAILSENDDKIKAASMSCLFQLAKHQYPSWILRDDAKKKLAKSLYGVTRNTQVASLQCLSQLVAVSKDTRNVDAVRQVQYATREILHVQNPEPGSTPSWIQVLRDLLHSGILQDRQTAVSCLARLIEDDIVRGVWIEKFRDIQRDTPSTLSQIVNLLANDRTGTHAVLVLYSMLDGISDTPFDKDRTVSELKTLIEKRHGEAKGAAVLCLRKLIEQDVELRKTVLDRHYIPTLVTSLFSKNHHCRSCDIPFVTDAFLAIAKHGQEPEQLKAILAFSKVICVDRWLPEKEGSILFCTLLSNVSLKTKEISIDTLIAIGRDRRDSDGAALSRTLTIFKAMCMDAGTLLLMLRQSVLQMILRGLKHRNALPRENAITFLDCLCAQSLGQAQSAQSMGPNETSIQASEVRKLTPLLSALLGNIAKLGTKNTKEALGTSRKALRVFCRYEIFKDRLLEPAVLLVISKDIDLKTANMRYGHGVDAQILGVRCWQELMKYDWVRIETYDKGLVNNLLDLYGALREEPESCQWLRLWPDYGKLLRETLEDLVDDHALFAQKAPLDSPLCERLRPFVLQPPLLKRQRSAVVP